MVLTPDSQILLDDETGDIQIGRYFQISPTGMTIVPGSKPDFRVFEEMVKVLRTLESGIQFAFGDFMNSAEGLFGEEASQLADEEDWSTSTRRSYQWVAGKVPMQIRRKELTFSHHHLVAKLDTVEEQQLWLDRAVEGTDGMPWTVAELRKAMKNAARQVVFDGSTQKFQVVVECDSAADVEECCRQLETLGRTKYKKHTPDAP
jgi:hypothetical protein